MRSSDALVLQRPGHFVESTFPLPAIGADEFLVKVELVTVCGGDVIEYQGGNRKGRYPLLMGHEVVGRVAKIGEHASVERRLVEGDRLTVEPYIRCGSCKFCISGEYQFCVEGMTYGVTIPCNRPPHLWGGYAQYMYGAPGARTHRVGEEVPAAAACMITVVGNAVRWVRTRGRVRLGESVLVTGLGAQALASVLVAKMAGAAPVVVVCKERDGRRQQLARDFGADAILILNPHDGEDRRSVVDHLLDFTDGGVAVAVECTGVEQMFALAVEGLAPRGRLVAVGTRGGAALSVDLDGIVFKELDILGGLGQANDTELAARIVNQSNLPIERMVSHTFPLASAEEGIKLMMERREDVSHVALDPSHGL